MSRSGMRHLASGENHIRYFPERLDECSPAVFDPDYWQARQALQGEAHGRGTTWFVCYDRQPMVLRHYYRGGWISRLSRDRFLYCGQEFARSFRELALLARLHAAGLPVPRPVAARIRRQGLFYQADILQTRIPHAEDLISLLGRRALSPEEWHTIGSMLADFHQAQVFHADLNSHNILLDASGKPWLIDFDKGAIRRGERWKAANLARLARSLRKEKQLQNATCWQAPDWDYLMAGYQAATR